MGISIVIPLYNKERHIQRAINSVLDQTYQKFEIIVVNDGSTDDSVNKVYEIDDERIKLFTQDNCGVSAARNRGIQECKNDLIAFLDADDAWKPHFLETIRRLRDNYPQAGIYGTAYEFQKPNGNRIPAIYNNIPYDGWEGIVDDYFKASIKNQLLWSSAVAVPKKVFNDIGYFTVGMTRGEDLDMWLRIAIKYKVAFSNKICSVYHQDADNRACNNNVAYSKSFISKAEDFYKENINTKNISLFFEEYMIRVFITKAIHLIEMGKRKEARALLKKYNHTKFFKKQLNAVYISSFLPNKINDLAFTLRSRFKSIIANKKGWKA